MKRLFLFTILLLVVSGCQDDQKRFCIQASTTLCERCQSCGGDFKACGLNRVTTKDECISTLQTVCSAYDSLYSSEVSRTCLRSLEQLTCEQLKTEGKPEVCTRLF